MHFFPFAYLPVGRLYQLTRIWLFGFQFAGQSLGSMRPKLHSEAS